MTTLFFDEAGYTGNKLSDGDQPAFVLASHAVSEADSAALLHSCFSRSKADEIKHKDLRRTPVGRAAVVALVDAIRSDDLPIAQYVVHKRFALFQRFFDFMVEPAMKDLRFEAYEQAFNIAATNAAYLGLPPCIGQRRFHRILELFETAARERSHPHLAAVWQSLERARAEQEGSVRSMIDMLLVGKPEGSLHLNAMPDNPLDVSLSTMVALVVHWRRLSPGPFHVLHDETSAMTASKPLWDWLSSPGQQEATLGFGDFRDMILPLNVERTELCRSHAYAGLQLADVLAGAQLEVCRHVMGRSNQPDYAVLLMEAGLDRVVNNIWPDADWSAPETPGAPGAVDPLDFIARGPGLGRRRRV